MPKEFHIAEGLQQKVIEEIREEISRSKKPGKGLEYVGIMLYKTGNAHILPRELPVFM